jgi:hypothetical protein
LKFNSVRSEGPWYRLIPSRFPPIALYERVAPANAAAAVTAIEDLTNPRLQAKKRLMGVAGVDESSPKLQNWNLAPFTYLNPEGTWLLDPIFGALELSDSLQTALAVSVRRRELFFSRTSELPLDFDMRVFSTAVSGSFADLRDLDANLARSARWRIGQELLEAGANGALFTCPVRRAGQCLAVFKGDVLQRTVQAEHFRFVWDGERIRSVYRFDKGEKISAEELFKDSVMQAA